MQHEWFFNLRGDILSGLVVALIPEAIAFSIIADVDPKNEQIASAAEQQTQVSESINMHQIVPIAQQTDAGSAAGPSSQ